MVSGFSGDRKVLKDIQYRFVEKTKLLFIQSCFEETF